MNCEKGKCYIGMITDYDDTRMVTLDKLKEHIEGRESFAEYWNKFHDEHLAIKTYSLIDYCDKRKSTDLTQFRYCPLCGKKIDWKAIRKGGAE